MTEFLEKKYSIAPSQFNRWLVPPAALAIHLCIGMAYGFSVFWIPLSQIIGVSSPLACPANIHWWEYLYRTDCDWPISMLGWTYTLFFVLLGSAAAVWGSWVEREGPRKAGFVSACCWAGGLLLAAAGIKTHQLWLVWLGSGVIGGIGLGLGYISPISTLIKWFPDRRGMATGMAIMGFGGGAMIGSPLANNLMNYFSTESSTGVWETFCVMAAIYFVFMTAGAIGYRLPAADWEPATKINSKINTAQQGPEIDVRTAMRTSQFWLLWVVLCVNVTAGIGILGMASPLLQEIFGGRLISLDISFDQLDASQKKEVAMVAAGFTGLLSLFNIAGRILWATISDRIGRKNTYTIFLSLGCLLYCTIPFLGKSGFLAMFTAVFCIILSMYGGGFATIPAYLSDLFGTKMVSAIHGRLLTAWSTAGILGPVLVNYLREYQISQGIPTAEAYNKTLYLLGGLLIIGLICNAVVKPVNAQKNKSANSTSEATKVPSADSSKSPKKLENNQTRVIWWLLLSWAAVLIPLAWGAINTFKTILVLFR